MKDLLKKLADLDKVSGLTHQLILRADGEGSIICKRYVSKPFSSIQDCREKMYRLLMEYKGIEIGCPFDEKL